ncbi:MAG: selenocysteine-specific translation elongation factor [Pseudomonadales bacterium]
MIVTLAGHVDHGKSTLVERITGGGTDRLAEERRRGLTIDLGFAYLKADGQTLGFVDVPGHHRFIHNMVAGVATHQHALLVIAADDGPMPQTREHLQILELMGIRQGTVALTKCDRVTAERLQQAHTEIRGLLAGTPLADAAVFETAALSGQGVDALVAHLLTWARNESAPAHTGPFRLAVDRAFQLKGTGLVVTGTVHGGAIAVDGTVRLFPGDRALRVRGLHVQNQPATSARAGDRAAINLAGHDGQLPQRGAWLTALPEPGHRVLVTRLKVLDDFPRPVRHWTPVHVYQATSHSTARLALLDGSRAQPGDTVLAHLQLDEPLPARHGDRLVVRDHGLDRTLGGGSVIDNRPWRGRRRHPARLREVEALEGLDPARALAALLALGPVDIAPLHGLWHLDTPDLEALLAGSDASAHQGRLVADARWQAWRQMLQQECQSRHAADAALQGLRENDFEAPVPADFRAELLNELTTAGTLQQRARRYQPARHQAALSGEESALLERLRPLLDQPQPPSLGDIGKILRMPLRTLQSGVAALAGKGALAQVNERRLYLADRLMHLADVAQSLSGDREFTAREFRDAAGIGRNVAIDVLEYFDARGFTRRLGDTRRVVGDRSRILRKSS